MPQPATDQAWALDHIVGMLTAAADDVSAFLLAAQAVTPAELRALAAQAGVPDLDSLREVTVRVTCAVRDLDALDEVILREWVHLWSTDRRAAATLRRPCSGVVPGPLWS